MHQLLKYCLCDLGLAVAMALVASTAVSAQRHSLTTLSDSTHAWFSLGLGASRAAGGGGSAARGAVSVQYTSFVVTGRGTVNTGGEGYSGRDVFRDAGILAGYTLREGESWHTIGSVGIGVVTGNRAGLSSGSGCILCSGDNYTSLGPRIGVPVELGVFGHQGNFATAFVVHANINGEEVFGGFTINVMVGVLD